MIGPLTVVLEPQPQPLLLLVIPVEAEKKLKTLYRSNEKISVYIYL